MAVCERHEATIAAPRVARKLSRDHAGQVSFALVAVAILLAAGSAGALFAKRELDRAKSERNAELLESIRSAMDETVLELELVACSRAQSTLSSWNEYPVNQTRLDDAFSSSVEQYISATFPRTDRACSVSVCDWSCGLFLLEKRTFDLVPDDGGKESSIELDGTVMEYEQLPSPSTETVDETVANPYYVVVGEVCVEATSSEIVLTANRSFEKPLVSALPLVESKLRAFEASTDGELSDLGRIVSYMLDTLAQLRTLEGHGMPMYLSDRSTGDILTEEDAYRAIAVGLLIEQARVFRAVDQLFAEQVALECGGESLGATALLESSGRYLDPAELFLWFLGMQHPNIDGTALIAQAMCGIADNLVLRHMDYLGWMGALDFADRVMDGLDETLASVMSHFTGEDKEASSVRRWISRSIELTGMPAEAVTVLFSNDEDIWAYVPERCYTVEDAGGTLYPVWVGGGLVCIDLPEHSLLDTEAWGGFYPQFKECQATLSDMIGDSVTRLAFDLAAVSEIEFDDIAFDPTDDEGLFEALACGVGTVRLGTDPDAIMEAGSKLPMYSAQDTLASALDEFVSLENVAAVPDCVVLSAFDLLTDEIIDGARHEFIPNLGVPVEQQLETIVRNDLQLDDSWNVGESLMIDLETRFSFHLNALVRAVNSSVTRADDQFSGPLVDSFASALAFGVDSFPSLKECVEKQLSAFARGVVSHARLTSHKQSVYVDLENPLEFWDGDRDEAVMSEAITEEQLSLSVDNGLPPLQVVPYNTSAGLESLDNLFPDNEILVQIRRPWDYDRSEEEYPNTHLTAVGHISPSPYSAQWLVSARGLLNIRTWCEEASLVSLISDEPVESWRLVKIDICVPIIVHSPWPLDGVEYNPTNTLLSDASQVIQRFHDILWEKLEPILGWLKDGFERSFRFLGDAFMLLSSYSTRVLKALAVGMQVTVELLQQYLQKFADSALAKAVKLFIDLVGTVEVRVSLYGFTLIIRTNLPDLLYRKSQDLVRIIVCTDRFGPGIAFGFRIAKLTDGRYDIVVNGTLTLKHAKVEVVVDPLMIILRRFVEVHCRTDSWGLDMVIPEAEPYEAASVSTADLPGASGLLSNIPMPVLGLRASVEAGLRLKYSPPFPTDVVVNEFEANPSGDDGGKEWVELYNPLDRPRCIDGWTIETTHGESKELEIHGTLPPGGLLVFWFPETSIDNGNPGDPFNDGDAILLRDAEGKMVDLTLTLRDAENDGKTHQRMWDGGPRWALRAGTQGDSNGPAMLLATSDFIAKALFVAFKEAFQETKLSEVAPSLDFVALLGKRVLHHFIENLLSIVGEIIHEVILFVEVLVSDVTGSAGFGFRASFVVTGESIVELLRWLIHAFATFVVNLGRASNPIAYPTFPQAFFAGLYLRFEVLFEIGTPRMLKVLGVTDQLQNRLTCVVSISPNIPCLGRVAGRDWGQWRIDFGVYLEGVPREFVSGFLLKDTGDLVDLWLVKGRVFGV